MLSICTGTQKEEVPPIIPYQGDIYTEVEKTGLFASQNKLATNEQEYSTVSMNITPQVCTWSTTYMYMQHVENM